MNKVYIVCEPTKVVDGAVKSSMDLTPAAKFGETVILVPYAQALLATVPTVRLLKDKLSEFTDHDYLLPVGDPVLMSIAAMIAAQRTGGRVKFLKWDRNIREYFVLQVDLSGKAV